MPEIVPFAGLRYNVDKIGKLSDVIAPPYDVISPEMQDELLAKHPNNVVRLILDKISPSDTESDNRYTRTARTLNDWKASQVLVTEPEPALYVYHQIYTAAGRDYCRKGFMCGVKADPFGEGLVFPHELTLSGPKADRLMLTVTCKTNFSQVFGLYPDDTGEVQKILDAAVQGLVPVEAVDHLGVLNRMWAVTDSAVITEVKRLMAGLPVFIADGHHRYETACNYRKQIAEMGELTPDHPANHVLMMCVAMDDPGLIVLPTHRLFSGVPEWTMEELSDKLGKLFHVKQIGDGAESAGSAWAEIERAGCQNQIALYTAKDQKWSIASLTEDGREEMDKAAAEHHPEWRELGVGILHRLIVDTVLRLTDMEKPKYVHLIEEVVAELRTGGFPLAALVMPATVGHIRSLSLMGERMPPKSTYFYPKLAGGLVFKPLE
ncbi:MAG: DUF1015 domain-containing protein [Planctomycetaceae bacterium]|jgi:uncharacterized protein (DUF1015 family)|nr:DUF1015 domain-containing protein [Planctomycetaceae bacterium]